MEAKGQWQLSLGSHDELPSNIVYLVDFRLEFYLNDDGSSYDERIVDVTSMEIWDNDKEESVDNGKGYEETAVMFILNSMLSLRHCGFDEYCSKLIMKWIDDYSPADDFEPDEPSINSKCYDYAWTKARK